MTATHDDKLNNKRKEEKKKETEDSPNEKREIAIHGAILKCPFAATPGKLVVTSNELKFQDKICATEGDIKNMINIQFEGPCGHPKWAGPKPPPMCKAVINLTPWENLGTTKVHDQQVLIKESTTRCDPTPNAAVPGMIPKIESIAISAEEAERDKRGEGLIIEARIIEK